MKSNFQWDSAPDPTGRTYSASPDTLVVWGGDTQYP